MPLKAKLRLNVTPAVMIVFVPEVAAKVIVLADDVADIPVEALKLP